MVSTEALQQLHQEESRNEQLHVDEKPQLKISKLENLTFLSGPHARSNEKHTLMLNKASEEIAALIRKPIIETLKEIERYKNTNRGNTLESQLPGALGSIEFLDTFCAYLCNPEHCDKLHVEVYEDKNGGVDLIVRPQSKNEKLGVIGTDDVTEAKITIRTGSKQIEDLYTPMKLGFSFKNYDVELGSLRVEIHTGRDAVQVDAMVGGENFEKKHMNIVSLSESGEMLNNFRVLLNTFLINLTELHLRNSSEVIELKNTKGKEEAKEVLKRNYETAKKFIGIRDGEEPNLQEVLHSEAAEVVIPTVEKKLENNAGTDAIGIVADAIRLNSVSNDSVLLSKLSDTAIVINWLFGISQKELTPQTSAKLVPYLRSLSDIIADFEKIPPWNKVTNDKKFEKEYASAEGIASVKYFEDPLTVKRNYLRLFTIKHVLTDVVSL